MSNPASFSSSSKVRWPFPFRIKEKIKIRLPGKSHCMPRRKLLRCQTNQEVCTPFWRSIEYSQRISDLPELRDCILTPKMRIINKRWKNCNILTDYLVPLYLVDPEYYPNIQHTDSLQALTEHYPLGTSPYIIYLHEEFLLLRGIQELNNADGFLRISQHEKYGDINFKWHVSVALEILSWLLIPNWCCICCDKNAEGIYRAAQLFNIEALVNLLEQTPYGPFLKSDDHHDQTGLEPPHTNNGMPLHSIAVPLETKCIWPTCLFWSANLDYRDLRRVRRGMHLVDQTFFALEVLNEWPFQMPLGRLLSSTNNVYHGEVDLSKTFLDSRGEILRIYTPLDVQKLGITMRSFLDCITRITRNAHSLSQSGNQINPVDGIGLDQYQRPGDDFANENFSSFGTEEGSEPEPEPPCFSMQILDPLEKSVKRAARRVGLEKPADDLFFHSFERNSRPCYFFDSYENRPHVLITGNAKTLELFLRSYSLWVGDLNIVNVALRIRNPSPEICHAVAKSVRVVGYDSLMQSMYIVEERVHHMLNLLSLFQNLSRVLELHSIPEIKEIPPLYIYETADYEMDSRDLQELGRVLRSHEAHIYRNRASLFNVVGKIQETVDQNLKQKIAENKELKRTQAALKREAELLIAETNFLSDLIFLKN